MLLVRPSVDEMSDESGKRELRPNEPATVVQVPSSKRGRHGGIASAASKAAAKEQSNAASAMKDEAELQALRDRLAAENAHHLVIERGEPATSLVSIPADVVAGSEEITTTNVRALCRFITSMINASPNYSPFLHELLHDVDAEEQVMFRHNEESLTVAGTVILVELMPQRLRDTHPGIPSLNDTLALAASYVNAAFDARETFLSAELDFFEEAHAAQESGKPLDQIRAMRLVAFSMFEWYEWYYHNDEAINRAMERGEVVGPGIPFKVTAA